MKKWIFYALMFLSLNLLYQWMDGWMKCVQAFVDVTVRTRFKSKLDFWIRALWDILYDSINIKMYATNKIVVKHKIIFKSVVAWCSILSGENAYAIYELERVSEWVKWSNVIHNNDIYTYMYVCALESKHIIYG